MVECMSLLTITLETVPILYVEKELWCHLLSSAVLPHVELALCYLYLSERCMHSFSITRLVFVLSFFYIEVVAY